MRTKGDEINLGNDDQCANIYGTASNNSANKQSRYVIAGRERLVRVSRVWEAVPAKPIARLAAFALRLVAACDRRAWMRLEWRIRTTLTQAAERS